MLALRPQKQIVFNSTSLSDQASKYWLPVKSSPRNPSAGHSTAPEYPAIDNFRQLMNLLARQKLAFIHQHAVNRL
jgi:hypothetical protein